MKATQFERIVPLLLGFAQQHHWEADARRRTDGFRLKDALHFYSSQLLASIRLG
jgi:hypothetical protein